MSTARILLDRLVDDAGLFPPARKPMAEALADHRSARTGEHAWMLGRFLCPVSRLGELRDAGPDDGWRLGAICDGDDPRADLAAVARWDGPGRFDGVELRLPLTALGTVLDTLPEGADAYVEVPTDDTRAMTTALEDLAADGRAGAKLRCGGLTPDAFPSDEAVAHFVLECRRLGLRFKATAGLHHPFRTRDEDVGVLQHGFVNLLAAAALPDGTDLVGVVAERDPAAFDVDGEAIAWRGAAGEAAVARARFVAYGSCSFDEPVADLREHGLLDAGAARA